ncbi:MAG: GNAT family N-acetyltransferase [Bacteroidetes bacterium]|nr:MAG: GNAT family N-acetyltransferase [Bacteroidota bacterium]
MTVTVTKISDPATLQLAFDIRVKVFVDEQGVDRDLEYEHEEESTHFIALVDGEEAGTARWRKTEKGIKLERFAVLPDFRSAGVGRELVKAVLNDIDTKAQKVYLHAQSQVVDFYKKQGFEPEGEEFEEAGIKHFKMVLRGL